MTNTDGKRWGERQLRDSDYRVTKPRKAILEVLKDTKEHPSAEELYQQVYKQYPAIGLTTVYRTLDLFEEIGLVHKFEFGDGKARYEINLGPAEKSRHHHHLVCTNCKRVIDYTDFVEEELELVSKTEKALEKRHDFEIRNHMIEFYGLCGNCRRSTAVT
jgi:Fur family ferric uptake transcriptional regulator